jgi:hypothetical protein
MIGKFDLEIVDTVFDPASSDNTVFRRTPSQGAPLYKVWLYLKGESLPYVESVTYKLHPTFAKRVHKVQRTHSNPDCRLVIWTWGLFKVHAVVETRRGETYELEHDLRYDADLRKQNVKFISA